MPLAGAGHGRCGKWPEDAHLTKEMESAPTELTSTGIMTTGDQCQFWIRTHSDQRILAQLRDAILHSVLGTSL